MIPVKSNRRTDSLPGDGVSSRSVVADQTSIANMCHGQKGGSNNLCIYIYIYIYIYLYIHLISYISYIPIFWAWPRHFSMGLKIAIDLRGIQ